MCDAKIAPFSNRDVILTCEIPGDHHDQHESTLRDYAYPSSETKITWHEMDRRTFRGDLIQCEKKGHCLLPNNHRGNCA